MDIFQGKMKTISPTMGAYDLEVYLNVDKLSAGVTGVGETGTGTLTLTNFSIGVTGMNPDNFKNITAGRW